MRSDDKKTVNFLEFFRLVFVLFLLYLLRDAFFRWDGFSYYASISEFLPGVALASVLWSAVSLLFAVLTWLLFRFLEYLIRLTDLEVRMSHVLFYFILFLLFGVLAWNVKKLIWPFVHTTYQLKLAVLLLTAVFSIVITWCIRGRVDRILNLIFERITPLVWLFSALVILSVPVVAYHAWFKDIKPAVLQSTNLPGAGKRPNIILVTFDALSAKNMSAYGYYRKTTPFIEKWAENATVFSFAEASSNFTTPAVASFMTGKRVWTHQTYHIDGMKPVMGDVESLPAVLKANGYFNMAFVVNPFASVKTLGMSRSFDIAPPVTEFGKSASLFGWKFGVVDKILYRAFGEKVRMYNWIIRNDFILGKFINLISRNISRTTVPPDMAFNRFLESLDSNPPGPFFAWIHLFPPHDPYLPPEPFKGEYNTSEAFRTYKSQEGLIEESYKYLFQHEPIPDEMQPSVDLMRDYYDECIRYIDEKFVNFINQLNEKQIENTIIILSADHGESFEHGYFTHGGPFLYEQVTRIPLIIKEPGQKKGQTVDAMVEQIDIPATILDLVNIPVPPWMEGRTLTPLMRGEAFLQQPAFSMNFEQNRSRGHKITTGSVAVWDGDYKLIHYLETGESWLFNLKLDPDEVVNIINEEPEIARSLQLMIEENIIPINRRALN